MVVYRTEEFLSRTCLESGRAPLIRWKKQCHHPGDIRQVLGSTSDRLAGYNIIPSRDGKVGTLCWPELKFHTRFTTLAGLSVLDQILSWQLRRGKFRRSDACKPGLKQTA